MPTERVGTARVRLDHIEPNPWRRLDSYPIDEAKIEQLQKSIERTEFWDNLVMRRHPDGRRKGIYQTSYGHHRMEALRRLYGPGHEIGIIVRDLTDAKMLQIMAAENDDVYDLSVAVIFETVIAARDFLVDHREEMLPDGELQARYPVAGHERVEVSKIGRKVAGGVGPPPEFLIGEPTHVFRNNYTRETLQCAAFLDWPISRCREALLMAKSPYAELLTKFRNMRVAEEFKRQSKRYTDLSPATLETIAGQVVEEDMGRAEVARTFQAYAIMAGDYEQRQANKLVTMGQVLRKAASKIRSAMVVISEVSSIRNKFGDMVYTEALEQAEFELALDDLIRALEGLRGPERGDADVGEIAGEIIEIERRQEA